MTSQASYRTAEASLDDQASPANVTDGERATYYVTDPTRYDEVPAYSRTVRPRRNTAANRWGPNTSIDIVPAYSEPSAGITIKWDRPWRAAAWRRRRS